MQKLRLNDVVEWDSMTPSELGAEQSQGGLTQSEMVHGETGAGY